MSSPYQNSFIPWPLFFPQIISENSPIFLETLVLFHRRGSFHPLHFLFYHWFTIQTHRSHDSGSQVQDEESGPKGAYEGGRNGGWKEDERIIWWRELKKGTTENTANSYWSGISAPTGEFHSALSTGCWRYSSNVCFRHLMTWGLIV